MLGNLLDYYSKVILFAALLEIFFILSLNGDTLLWFNYTWLLYTDFESRECLGSWWEIDYKVGELFMLLNVLESSLDVNIKC
jgi:hypothetical protein